MTKKMAKTVQTDGYAEEKIVEIDDPAAPRIVPRGKRELVAARLRTKSTASLIMSATPPSAEHEGQQEHAQRQPEGVRRT